MFNKDCYNRLTLFSSNPRPIENDYIINDIIIIVLPCMKCPRFLILIKTINTGTSVTV